MFEIFHIIGKNVTEKPETIRLPHRPPPPEGFRGLVLLDPQRCIGCGMCTYVCVSESVTGASDEAQYHWQYEPGRCTFCARCVDHCPADALRMSVESPPPYSRPGELDARHTVPFPPCQACGKPTRPTPETMKDWVAENIHDDTQHLYGLCDRCKRLHYQTAMKSMLSAAPKEELR